MSARFRLLSLITVALGLSAALMLNVSPAERTRSTVMTSESRQETRLARRELRNATAKLQTVGKATPKLEGCVSCHAKIEPMHKYGTTETLEQIKGDKDAVGLTCTACHGGNPLPKKTTDDSKEIERIKHAAHVQPRFPNEWRRQGKSTGANPERSNTLLERESLEFVRFINPGDLRVAQRTCGECHAVEERGVAHSMMTHGALLWGAALYNNGSFPSKDARFGESYNESSAP